MGLFDSILGGGLGAFSPSEPKVAAPAQPTQTAAPFDWSGLWGGLANSNQQQFDWTKNSFGMTLDEQKRQADMQNAIQQQQLGLQGKAQQSQLAQALLAGAASLRGPADWLSYANYTNGGKGIFDMLYGSQAAPAFGSPTGNSTVMTIQKLLADLGLNNIGGGGAGAGAGAGAVPDAAAIQQWATGLNDPVAFARGGEFVQKYGRLPQSIAEWDAFKNGTAAPASGTAQIETALDKATAPITEENAVVRSQPVTEMGAPNTTAPLPFQINPAVWDSLSATAKTMILASAMAGNTPSGAWSADDYLNQLNAARPQGTAPQTVSYGYGNQGYY